MRYFSQGSTDDNCSFRISLRASVQPFSRERPGEMTGEQARHGVDALWDEMMLNTRARELFNRYLKRDRTDTLAATDSLPLLARTASVIAAAHRRTAPLKK